MAQTHTGAIIYHRASLGFYPHPPKIGTCIKDADNCKNAPKSDKSLGIGAVAVAVAEIKVSATNGWIR